MPGVDEPSSAEELRGGSVPDGPFDLAIREGIEPLEKHDPKVEPQRQVAAQPPGALGRGALQLRKYPIRQGLPRDHLGPLEQRMGGGDLDGHGLQTAGRVESSETHAHGEEACSVTGARVLWASDHESLIVFARLPPLTL